MDQKWAFVINPVSGNGAAETIIPVLKKKIKQFNINAELFYTQYPGHASEIASQCADAEYKFIITVGGDGTLNEATKFLLGKKNIISGIIPAGTGNDFIPVLGFPERFADEDWNIFFQAQATAVDAGKVNDFHFLNGMGLGFDAEVAAQNYDKNEKVRQGGKNKYVWHILKTLFFFKELNMTTVSGEEQKESACFIHTIANGRRFAGSFFLTPQAVANDGLLDVCMIRKLALWQRLPMLLKVPKGIHIHDDKVRYYKSTRLILKFPLNVPFHVDGELHFSKQFDVKVLPAALTMIYNPKGKHYLNI